MAVAAKEWAFISKYLTCLWLTSIALRLGVEDEDAPVERAVATGGDGEEGVASTPDGWIPLTKEKKP